MSLSKRVLFGGLPEDDPIRADMARAVADTAESFPIRARPRPSKPKRELGVGGRDSVWAGALGAALHDLGIRHFNKNGVPHFRTVEDRDRIHEAAVLRWNARWEELASKRTQPVQSRISVSSRSRRSNRKSSAPFILTPIPADPYPCDEDLLPYRTGGSGVPGLERFIAELKWREARIEQDQNTFLVPYVSLIRPAIDYNAYLRTPLWKGIKRKVLDKAGRKCACCQRRATEVHHRDYRPRVLLGEDLSPLVPVCRPCHDLIEGERNRSWQDGEAKLAGLVEAENRRLAMATGFHP